MQALADTWHAVASSDESSASRILLGSLMSRPWLPRCGHHRRARPQGRRHDCRHRARDGRIRAARHTQSDRDSCRRRRHVRDDDRRQRRIHHQSPRRGPLPHRSRASRWRSRRKGPRDGSTTATRSGRDFEITCSGEDRCRPNPMAKCAFARNSVQRWRSSLSMMKRLSAKSCSAQSSVGLGAEPENPRRDGWQNRRGRTCQRRAGMNVVKMRSTAHRFVPSPSAARCCTRHSSALETAA